MIKAIKLKPLVAVVLVVVACFVLSVSLVANAKPSHNYSTPYTIVIDAGHGGIDGGCVGVGTGKDENYLNLEYALCLSDIMEKYNLNIVLTRTNLNGLYGQFSENKKIDDMQKRKQIAIDCKADIVISLHMNSFPLQSCRGAQVFYKENNQPSQKLAECVQSVFVKTLPEARESALVGDYYMLNEFEIPSVIVECGYLSNPEEEQLLLNEEYKKLVCSSIFIGVLKFLAN